MWHRPVGAVEWAPDGEGFLFMRTIQAATSNADIWWAAVDGTPQPFIVTESNERNPRFSRMAGGSRMCPTRRVLPP